MTHLQVHDVMTTDVVVARPDTPFHEIARLLAHNGVSALPVVDADRRVVGVVSEADLLHKVEFAGDEGGHPFERPARRMSRRKARAESAEALMSAPAISVPAGTSVVRTARMLESFGVKRMPVVDDLGRLIGIVARRDLLMPFLRPDSQIRDEVIEDVLERALWIGRDDVAVEVDDGVVTLRGEVEQRSLVPIVLRLVGAVDGVVEVVDRLTYRVDDAAAAQPRYYRPLV